MMIDFEKMNDEILELRRKIEKSEQNRNIGGIDINFQEFASNYMEQIKSEKDRIKSEAQNSSIVEVQNKISRLQKEKKDYETRIAEWEKKGIDPNDNILKRLKEGVIPNLNNQIRDLNKQMEEVNPNYLRNYYDQLEKMEKILKEDQVRDMRLEVSGLSDTEIMDKKLEELLKITGKVEKIKEPEQQSSELGEEEPEIKEENAEEKKEEVEENAEEIENVEEEKNPEDNKDEIDAVIEKYNELLRRTFEVKGQEIPEDEQEGPEDEQETSENEQEGPEDEQGTSENEQEGPEDEQETSENGQEGPEDEQGTSENGQEEEEMTEEEKARLKEQRRRNRERLRFKNDKIENITIKEDAGKECVRVIVNCENKEEPKTFEIDVKEAKKLMIREDIYNLIRNVYNETKNKKYDALSIFRMEINPVILKAINSLDMTKENKQNCMKEYLTALVTEGELENFTIAHDRSDSELSWRNSRRMRTYARQLRKVDGAEVYGLEEPILMKIIDKLKNFSTKNKQDVLPPSNPPEGQQGSEETNPTEGQQGSEETNPLEGQQESEEKTRMEQFKKEIHYDVDANKTQEMEGKDPTRIIVRNQSDITRDDK